MKHPSDLAADLPTIALIVTQVEGKTVLAETLTDAEEILELDLALRKEDPDPIERVHEFRAKKHLEEEEFADFVEGLLSQPFVKPDVQEHAVQWFKSRAKIEAFQKAEDEASRVIAQYAFQVFQTTPSRVDFLLAGPRAKVRIRVLQLERIHLRNVA